jgi:hypothetical protein
MRKNSGGIKALLLNLLFVVTLPGPAMFLHAQTNGQALEGLDLPLISPESLPQTGTFYLLSSLGTNGFAQPWPFNPVADQGVDTFWLGSNTFGNAWPGSFIVDDSAIDYQALRQQMPMDSPEPPPPPGGGGGGSTEDGPVPDAYS